jgi:nucleoside-diphosphate-sugar epimerase
VKDGFQPVRWAIRTPEVYSLIARGGELVLPNLGHETLHHVHADDVAQWIIRAIENRAASVGEIFNTVSEQAVALRGYAKAVYRWFGKEPRISFKPCDEWILDLGEYAENSRGHVVRSSSHSIEKSRQRLGYRPRYTSLEGIRESMLALITDGVVSPDATLDQSCRPSLDLPGAPDGPCQERASVRPGAPL